MNPTRTVVATKMLTFVPLALALYYFDLANLPSVLSSAGSMALVTASLSVFFLELASKRSVVMESLELSRPSYGWGAGLLAGSAMLYIVGSYTAFAGALHYESFLLFLLSYVAFRTGVRVIESVFPLLPILVLGPVLPSLVEETSAAVLLLPALAFVAFAVRPRTGVRSLTLPMSIVAVGLLAWWISLPPVTGDTVPLWPLVPLPFVLLFSDRIRSALMVPKAAQSSPCDYHHGGPNGYCAICGKKALHTELQASFSAWGLITIVGVVIVLVLASVPVLALSNGALLNAEFSARGISGSPIPGTPQGWQVNSTTYYGYNASVPYAVSEVYVPVYHPEVKNYTAYFEVATSLPNVPAPGGGEIRGWNRLSNNYTLLGPLEGYLTAYSNSSQTLIAYRGTTTMTVQSGGSFQVYYLGLGFARVFKNTNAASDALQFMADMNSYWKPEIESSFYYSGWTASLSSTYNFALTLVPFFGILSTSLLMVWVAYRARLSDEKIDDFLRRVSRLRGKQWETITTLLARQGRSARGEDLAGGGRDDLEDLDSLYAGLSRDRLVEAKFAESGGEIVMLWRANL